MYVCQSFVSDKEMILRAVVRDGTAGRLEDQHISRKKINLSSSTFFLPNILFEYGMSVIFFTISPRKVVLTNYLFQSLDNLVFEFLVFLSLF